MPKPDGGKEDLGIIQLDEPALNCEDKTVLELKYVQSKNVVRSAPMTVDSIEGADKKPKEISRWINSINELQKTRPAPTVNYTKQMPDFDQMMSELHPELEDAMSLMGGAEIDMHSNDYARIILALLDVPVHKL
jgi:intraflagellar transport protein 46